MTSETQSIQIPTVQSFLKACPWIILIFVLAFLSWRVWEGFFALFMPAPSAQFASIGVSTMGAYAVSIFGLAGNWPLAGMRNPRARGVALLVLALAVAAVFWIIIGGILKIDLQVWSFPIIANSWFILSITSFVGGDAHFQDIPPVRRMLLNLLISAGGTLVLMRTIVIVPAYWFPFLQTIIITGGLGYYFRRTRQPFSSVLSWSLLFGLMWVFLFVASCVDHFSLINTPTTHWTWNLGGGTPEFGIFFPLACGLNFGVLACAQCWPFCRIKQPWATPVAVACMLAWCWLLTKIAIPLFQSIVPGEDALWQAQIMAWHTVFWGFAWVYCFGVGQTPYLWAGQKTPGTWDDVN